LQGQRLSGARGRGRRVSARIASLGTEPLHAQGLSFFRRAVFTSRHVHRERAMALWDRVKSELDRAGRVAQHALDEGRLRLEMLRAKRQVDGAAQKLGYAVYRARKESRQIPDDEYAALARAIEAAEAEVE